MPVAAHIVYKAPNTDSLIRQSVLHLLVPLLFNDYHNPIDYSLNRVLSDYRRVVRRGNFELPNEYDELIKLLDVAVVYSISNIY